MEFILEEIDIKDEHDTDNLDTNDLDTDDLDLGSSSHCLERKLNPNVECRAMLEKSLQAEKESQRYSDENVDMAAEANTGQNHSVDMSCGVYRKLKLLVDVLKNCDKRENCILCEQYIQQLQQHLLFSHGNNTRDTQEKNSIEIETTTSVSEPTSLNPTLEQNVIHAIDPSNNSEDGFVPLLTIRTEVEGETFSQNEDNNTIKYKPISKVGKSKPVKCETCGKAFLTFYDLTQHKSEHADDTRDTQKTIHIGDKPYNCDICGKAFTKISYLNVHKRIHTGEKPYTCHVCEKSFNQQSSLNHHKLLHTGEKPFKCDVCEKTFNQCANLNHHKLTHTGEKPFKYDVCEKAFNHHSNLKHHKLIHTGEKPFKCGLCGKHFAQNGNLLTHMRTHRRNTLQM